VVADGTPFTVEVKYRGRPDSVPMPGYHQPTGWVATDEGAFVANQPRGAPTWFPCNDHPTDKATYRFEVTVPKGRVAMANGVLAGRESQGGETTFTWIEDKPMATYLATVTNGRFKLVRSEMNGLPGFSGIDRSVDRDEALDAIRLHGQMVKWMSGWLGEYPFDSFGAIFSKPPEGVGYALETQGRPVYANFAPRDVYAHEVAHQWFGNSATFDSWKEIWLSEGFASWSQWYWKEDRGVGKTTAEEFRESVELFDMMNWWKNAPGLIHRRALIFNSVAVYERGAMTLEALRQTIGDAAFFETLRRWVSENAYGSVNSADFIALAEDESGQDLSTFFDQWLYGQERPDMPPSTAIRSSSGRSPEVRSGVASVPGKLPFPR